MAEESRKQPLVVFNTHPNRSSVRALLGAIETCSLDDELDIHILESAGDLIESSDALKEREPIIFALSFFTTQFWDAQNIITSIREIFGKKAIIVCGGPHPTGDPQGTLAIGADVVVIGEGEETFVELLRAIAHGKDYREISGIAYRDDSGELEINKKHNPIELDKYFPFSRKFRKYGAIEISRGCSHLCNFCQTPRIFGSKIRHRSVEKIIDAALALKKRGIKDIRTISPNALAYGSNDGRTPNLEAVETLLRELKRDGGKDCKIFFGSFPSEVRPETVSPEAMLILKEYVSNDNIVVGAQSGSERILNLYRRGHQVSDTLNAARAIVGAGFIANVDFIFGFPDETESDVKETMTLMNDLVKLGARIHAHAFLPLAGTLLWGKQPKEISSDLLHLIDKKISSGRLFGQWQTQVELGRRITQLFKD